MALRGDLKSCTTLLKKYFRKQCFPFQFSLSVPWDSEDVIENTNCYRYAFDISWKDDDQRIMGFLGWSIGKFEHSVGEIGFSRFEIDLKRMGFKFDVTTDAKTVPEKGYKIALFIYDTDFHFARQNADARWSEKNGFGAPVCLMQNSKGELITPDEFESEERFDLKIYHIYQ